MTTEFVYQLTPPIWYFSTSPQLEIVCYVHCTFSKHSLCQTIQRTLRYLQLVLSSSNNQTLLRTRNTFLFRPNQTFFRLNIFQCHFLYFSRNALFYYETTISAFSFFFVQPLHWFPFNNRHLTELLFPLFFYKLFLKDLSRA